MDMGAAGCRERRGLGGQQGQAEGWVLRPEVFPRVRLEGEGGEREFRPRGMRGGQHGAVAGMHAVQVAQRNGAAARGLGQGMPIGPDLTGHRGRNQGGVQAWATRSIQRVTSGGR